MTDQPVTWNELTEDEKAVLKDIESTGKVLMSPSTYDRLMWRFVDVEMDGSGELYLLREGVELLNQSEVH